MGTEGKYWPGSWRADKSLGVKPAGASLAATQPAAPTWLPEPPRPPVIRRRPSWARRNWIGLAAIALAAGGIIMGIGVALGLGK